MRIAVHQTNACTIIVQEHIGGKRILIMPSFFDLADTALEGSDDTTAAEREGKISQLLSV